MEEQQPSRMITRSARGKPRKSTTEDSENRSKDWSLYTPTESGTTSTEEASKEELNEITIMETKSQSTMVGRSPRSQKTTTSRSSRRRKELEARMEVERLELERAKAASTLAQTKLELVRLDEETDLSEEDEAELQGRSAAAVENWVEESARRSRHEGRPRNETGCYGGEPLSREEPPAPRKNLGQQAKCETTQLANAIMEAIKNVSPKPAPQHAPKYINELHPFSGDPGDWLAFKATYQDTEEFFTRIENVGRLRKAILGKAKEAVKSLLYTQSDPDVIVTALERRFGRPAYLIKSEITCIEKLPVMSEDAKEIPIYASVIANSVNTIKQMKKMSYLHSNDVSSKILEKMCTIVRFKWFEYRAASEEEEPILCTLMKFFNGLADQYESYEGASTAKMKREDTKKRPRNMVKAVHTTEAHRHNSDSDEDSSSCDDTESEEERDRNAVYHARPERAPRKLEQYTRERDNRNNKEKDRQTCPICNEEHYLKECKKFIELSTKEKWEVAKKNNICFKCLQYKHRRFDCRAKPCHKCGRNHHALLHEEEQPKSSPEPKQIPSVNAASAVLKAYLKITPVEITGPRGTTTVNALLDEGSMVTMIEKDVADKIGASGPEEELTIEGFAGIQVDEKKSNLINVRIKGLFSRNYNSMSGFTIGNLGVSSQGVSKKDIEGCAHLNEIADQLLYASHRPAILIGQDNWNLIVTREIKAGETNKPVASLTKLGWVLHGYKSNSAAPPLAVNHVATNVKKKDDELEAMIRKHFDIEAIGVAPKRPACDIEQRAIHVLDTTSNRLPDGRFSTGLIWKNNMQVMPESRTAAVKRLKGIEKKCNKYPEFAKSYEAQINNLIANGYAEQVQNEPTSPRAWYLPHFAVVHPQKKKIRLVFDAAAKSNGKCLNDALLPGPDLLQSLFGVLMRFREGPVAVMADIKEMFLQIRINEEDRDSLRFLWKDKEYRMTSLIFGAASSPCTAIYVKNKNAQDYENKYPDAVEAIQRNHYMDDYIASYPDAETAKRISKEVDAVHKCGAFTLRGWASNEPTVINDFKTNQEKNTSISLNEQNNHVEKTLGLNWNTDTDCLHFTLSLRNTPSEAIKGERAPTKRETTSAVMSVFDPLGLAAPITIQGKAMLQNIWRAGISWDETLTPELNHEWQKWLKDLRKLENLNIPRCISPDVSEGELHTFCDASERAYATAVYLRTQHPDGRIDVKLLAAKARVSPLKPTSIPRLELQACLLGSRLTSSIQNELNFSITCRYFWTDSRTALAWIKSDPRTFKPFVAHRLAEIEELTKQKEWRWVPTKQNVADDATRDVPNQFDIAHRWFNGPEYLRKHNKEWPADTSSPAHEPTGEEKPKKVILTATKTDNTTPDPKRFSKWIRLLRATGRFLQAIDIFKSKLKTTNNHSALITKRVNDPTWRKYNKKKQTAKMLQKPTTIKETTLYIPLDAEYLRRAEHVLVQRIQRESFANEISCIKNQKKINKGSKLRNLSIKLENGIMKLSTRVGAATYLSETYKTPSILDGKHHVTRLLVEHLHAAFGHGNHQIVMNEIRQKYWVTSLRNIVRATSQTCKWCKLRREKPQVTAVGDLPPERLSKGHSPFNCAAVDYFGPINVTVGRRVEKRWGVLFTCLSTRAIHLELAASLCADSMILALRRMIARRGTPHVIYSDNGTNFVGANKEITAEMKHASTQATERFGITWKFIPPGAPHMGGAWERMVRTVKTALAAVLHEKQPREEILHTLLLEVEHIVNSRPLTEVNLDIEEEEALTPNHFLIGRSNGAAPFGKPDDASLVGTANWKTAQRLADHFWARWVREYLPTLSPRYRNGSRNTDPTPGDVVLIVDASLPRSTWPRGEVTNIYPGPDGKVRVVDIRTATGTVRRPTSRLVILVPAATTPAPSLQPAEVQRTEGEIVSDGAQL